MVMRNARRGYTLMEVMLVMAVILIISAISWPAMDSLYEGVKLEAASDALKAGWSEAQARAVNEGRPYRFSVIPGKGNFRVAPDSADYWLGSNPAPDDPENPPLVMEKSLPKGIIFTPNGEATPPSNGDTAYPDNAVPSGEWSTMAVFLPDGTAEDDCDVTLRISDSRPISLHLRAMTGVVTVQRGGGEE
jgi:prepilin-type N-terminal cleavage/methylation domain-containing protein